MLSELRIRDLGTIDELDLVLPSGSVAITGETGAGKTMIVGAIQLLMGERADPDVVRTGADEAIVEARIIDPDGNEVIARRIVPAAGRSRAYLDGSLATAAALADRVAPLIDLHGQHSQQSLLRPVTQRHALDRFGGIDRSGVRDARADVAAIDAALADLGGDSTERARQVDLLRYQLDELAAAGLDDPDEDHRLEVEEDQLAHAFEHQVAAAEALEAIGADGPADEAVVRAMTALGDRAPFTVMADRLAVVQEQLSDIAAELRSTADTITDDPVRREEVRARRQLLAELRRKYGPTVGDVIAYSSDLASRLAHLESHDQQVAELMARRDRAVAHLEEESRKLFDLRAASAGPLARAVEAELTHLAMPHATVEVRVGGDAGDDVEFLLAPNPGMPALPLGKNASGGELSRAMLALRLVLSGGPPIKIFDEVDAGIGGETARAVGEALAALGRSAQVFVVTHLPQVAALANRQIVIDKTVSRGVTSSQARLLDEDERVVELSRMLSGLPDSSSARQHAEELLAGGAEAP